MHPPNTTTHPAPKTDTRGRLQRLTLSGADDTVATKDLAALSQDYPFIEWGILLSAKHQGKTPRYPSREWLWKLFETQSQTPINLAGHLCGGYARALLVGNPSPFELNPQWKIFQRLQINFTYEEQEIDIPRFTQVLAHRPQWKYIIQCHGRNREVAEALLAHHVPIHVLWDASGGQGTQPENWPTPLINAEENGYAGGLDPFTITQSWNEIQKAALLPKINLDIETRLRTPKPNKTEDYFDLGKCLAAAHQVQQEIAR